MVLVQKESKHEVKGLIGIRLRLPCQYFLIIAKSCRMLPIFYEEMINYFDFIKREYAIKYLKLAKKLLFGLV